MLKSKIKSKTEEHPFVNSILTNIIYKKVPCMKIRAAASDFAVKYNANRL